MAIDSVVTRSYWSPPAMRATVPSSTPTYFGESKAPMVCWRPWAK
ncbi:hypothetical protein [Massilia phosphatilytica]